MAEDNKEHKVMTFHGTLEQFKPMIEKAFPGGSWIDVDWGEKYEYLKTHVTFYYTTKRIQI